MTGAIENSETTSLSLVNGSTDVAIDSFKTEQVDMADIQKYGQGPGASAAGWLGHVVAEQFAKQVGGVADFRTAHNGPAAAAESAITGYQRGAESGQIIHNPNTGSLMGTISVEYTRGSEVVNVTTRVRWGNVTKVERN